MTSRLVAGLVLVAAISLAQTDAGGGAMLAVKVTGLKSADGKVLCTLYRGAAGFPADPKQSIQQRVCAIEGASSTCHFEAVSADTYAVACFHDEDGDGALKKGIFGIPKEGVGVSNDAKGSFGPPKYEDAKFTFSGAPSEITFAVRY